MTIKYPVDYHSIYDKVFSHYLGTEYYPFIEQTEEYKTEKKNVGTLDEYLWLLSRRYINVELHSDLNKHLMELLEDDWFFQWPLVRWTYASRLLYGTGHRKNVRRAVEILTPLVKEGYPGAMFDIGFCHHFSEGLELDYEKSICLWIESSKRGYRVAWRNLYSNYETGQYKNLNDELKFFFLYELFIHFPEGNGCTWDDCEKHLSKKEIEVLVKIYREGKRLDKIISKNFRSYSTASLFWDEEDNPYKIKF